MHGLPGTTKKDRERERASCVRNSRGETVSAKALSKVLVSGWEILKVGENKISCDYNTVGVVGNNPRACRCRGDESCELRRGRKRMKICYLDSLKSSGLNRLGARKGFQTFRWDSFVLACHAALAFTFSISLVLKPPLCKHNTTIWLLCVSIFSLPTDMLICHQLTCLIGMHHFMRGL